MTNIDGISSGKLEGEALDAVEALNVDPRAKVVGLRVAQLLAGNDTNCVMLWGPGYSGKSSAAMVARAIMDPDGKSSFHTGGQTLNTNSQARFEDRSAGFWHSWPDLMEAYSAGRVPKLLVIDEAGSTPSPFSLCTYEMAFAKKVLQEWKEAGTKFVVLGHNPNASYSYLRGWANWISQEIGVYGEIMARRPDEARLVRVTNVPDAAEEAVKRGRNDVARKNEIGADNRDLKREPPGNAPFLRSENWEPGE